MLNGTCNTLPKRHTMK